MICIWAKHDSFSFFFFTLMTVFIVLSSEYVIPCLLTPKNGSVLIVSDAAGEELVNGRAGVSERQRGGMSEAGRRK